MLVRTAGLALSLLAVGVPLCPGEAQSNAARAASQPKAAQLPDYRLTEMMVRRVSAIMREWDPTPTMGARLLGGHPGMSNEQFEALPDSQKERIMAENMDRANAKYQEGEKQIGKLLVGSLADRSAAADHIPALTAALGKAGLSTGEFVQAYVAYNRAMSYVLGEEFGPGPALPPGIRQDNVSLFRTMSKAEPLWTPLGLTQSKP